MKKIILFTAILLVAITQTTFSQEYHPLLNNSSWIIYDWVSCCRGPEERIIQEGTDVVIGSYTYKQFNDPFPSYIYYNSDWNFQPLVNLREEVTERKVYKLVNGVDVLLYDFSLEMGDTIFENTFIVSAVDYVDVDGGTRKRIKLQSIQLYCGVPLFLVWIEGVGSDKHPFYPDYNIYIGCSSGGGYNIYTKCSFQNGEHIYGNSDCSSLLNTNTSIEIATKIDFSPNPFTTELTIQSEKGFHDSTLKLYNSVGQLVRESKNLNGEKIVVPRENLKSGLYFAELQENGKIVKTTKIIIAD